MTRVCFDEDELLELASAPERAREANEREHLAQCAECRARLEELAHDSALFEELKGIARRRAGPPAIPGYRVEGELSRGGQGVVYRAVQEATQRLVALKVAAGTSLSARERRRFEREVELGSRLAHPGIVTLFDSGVSAGTPWYAMELVEGETLDAFVARTRPELAERLRLFLELCAAVAHAHRTGVIHRDLKPANVLVDSNGRVRVLDFGTARRLTAGRTTAPGEFLGTLAYAAPEEVAGGAELGDTRSDVYSLGVVLYELVAGRLPIDVDGALTDVVRRIVEAPPLPAGDVEPDLARVLATALAKERERRYPSVEALARDVAHFLAHEPIEARPRRAGYVIAKALRRHRGAVLAGVAALALALVLGGGYARERWNAQRSADQATLVRSLFEEVLASAAPERMGGDAPLRDVLALAAREIETTLRDAPDAQAAVQFTIGDTYRSLLMFPEAVQHLRLALARFRADDEGGLQTARCLDALGAALSEQGLPEAIPVQEEALAIRRALLDDADPRIAASERALAAAIHAQLRDADDDRALELLQSALARFRRTFGDTHVDVADTELALARLERDAPDSERLLDDALAIFERPENARDPRRIGCLLEVSRRLQARKRLDEAEQFLARADALTLELYGDERATEMLRAQANLRFAREDWAGAEELTRRALVAELRRWGRARPDEASAIEDVAVRLEDARPPEREPPYVEAFQWLRRFQGDGAFELAGWMNGIVVTLLPQGRNAESAALLREALNIRCRAWGQDCPMRERTTFLLGRLLCQDGATAEAEPLLRESLRIAEVQGDQRPARDARELLETCCAPKAERP